MNKAVIKIIKRRKAVVAEKFAHASQVSGSRAKAENIPEREMADAVAVWISVNRENKRTEEIIAHRKIFAWRNNSESYSGHG